MIFYISGRNACSVNRFCDFPRVVKSGDNNCFCMATARARVNDIAVNGTRSVYNYGIVAVSESSVALFLFGMSATDTVLKDVS